MASFTQLFYRRDKGCYRRQAHHNVNYFCYDAFIQSYVLLNCFLLYFCSLGSSSLSFSSHPRFIGIDLVREINNILWYISWIIVCGGHVMYCSLELCFAQCMLELSLLYMIRFIKCFMMSYVLWWAQLEFSFLCWPTRVFDKDSSWDLWF